MELLKDIGLVLLGAVLAGIVSVPVYHYQERRQRAEAASRERERKREAFERLIQLSKEIAANIEHGHDFRHKQDWAKELSAIGDRERDWIGDLYEAVKRISWNIRDRSFDHEQEDSQSYCCNELILDLNLLQLMILDRFDFEFPKRKETERNLAYEIQLCRIGHFRGDVDRDEIADNFLKMWRTGEITVDPVFGTSAVLGSSPASR